LRKFTNGQRDSDKETQGKDLKASSLPWLGPGITDVLVWYAVTLC
jgi:hypothetical protein